MLIKYSESLCHDTPEVRYSLCMWSPVCVLRQQSKKTLQVNSFNIRDLGEHLTQHLLVSGKWYTNQCHVYRIFYLVHTQMPLKGADTIR